MHQSVSRSIAFYWGLTLIIKIVAYYMILSVGEHNCEQMNLLNGCRLG